MESKHNLEHICHAMDKNGNGELTRDEIMAGYVENEEFRNILDSVGVSDSDLEVVWQLLDTDKSGEVTTKEFVTQVYKMKDSDIHFMLFYIKYFLLEVYGHIK